MVLIADSGSTSTNWRLLSPTHKSSICNINTIGLNPFHVSEEEIIDVIQNQVKPQIVQKVSFDKIQKIYFYGSGCSTLNKQELIKKCICLIFQNAEVIVDHDTMASAIAGCGDDIGIACILGTGSNSCVYDGKTIVKTLPSLGYMLGDEGSGTHIGKGLLKLVLKEKLPIELLKLFNEKYKLSSLDILNHLYRKEKPGAFISSFAPFVIENIEHKTMISIVRNSFTAFFDEFILPYPESATYPISFVGSIAALLSNRLIEIGKEKQLYIHNIIQYPIDALEVYHLNKIFRNN
ncbi:MAG: ATPase [Bacteroidales bacterium]|jgi:N-acetylglucosamine kinase-like BadF-type ATPase|nr:ATPase [Bacteroidales bacterium]